MTPRKIEPPEHMKAEGRIVHPDLPGGIAYNTETASAQGCALHLWMGRMTQSNGKIALAVRIAKENRDVVSVTYCRGEPTEYWCQHEMRRAS